MESDSHQNGFDRGIRIDNITDEPSNLVDVDIATEKLLLSQYVPASIVIDSSYQIVRFHGLVYKYLFPSSGKASLDVLNMVHEELGFELHYMVQQVAKDNKPIRKENISLTLPSGDVKVNIEVAPVRSKASEAHYLILFEEKAKLNLLEPDLTGSANSRKMRMLENQLKQAQEHLISLTEELKTTREDLQEGNEKMTAQYEEVLSINQELLEGKRALQAAVKELMLANEDLETENINLHENIDYSASIINAIREPLLLLNTNLSVHLANRVFYSTFRLTPADVEHRFLYEIGNSQWNVPELLAKLSEVVGKKNGFASFELPSADNRMLLFNAAHLETGNKRTDRIMITMQDVTQHRQAREAKEWLATVVEASNEGIISFTTNRTIISWNKGAEEIFGYTEAEMVSKSLSRLVKQNDKLNQHKLIERVMKGEIIRQFEMEHLHKDGHIIHVSISISVIRDVKENIKGLMASVQDITERKKAEEALRESEERYQPIVSESAVGIARADFDGRLLFTNQKFCNMLGFTIEELLGKTVWDLAYNNNNNRTKGLLKRMQEDGKPIEFERQLIRKNDTPIWVNINVSSMKDSKGQVASVTAVIIDISQRKEAEEALQKTKESLQIAFEAANMGSWEMDTNTGEIIYHSLRNDQLMGYNNWQTGWNLEKARRYVIEEDRQMFDEAISGLLSKGSLQMEFRVRWADGSLRWIYKLGKLFYDADGKPYRAAGISMDITDRKLAEQRKENLIGITSHELKTPVTSIKAYAQILHEQFLEQKNYTSATMLEKLDKQVDKLTILIKDLLDTTRITEGQLTLKQEVIDINSLIKEVADDMLPAISGHRIVKRLHPLPSIQADRERIRQVLINLISNAVKYSPEDDKIIVCTESESGSVTIHIQDFGIGISEEVQPKVFDRFYRVDDTNGTRFSGLGLGLFISSEIIKQHKGAIWVKSHKGEGATFSFSLPANN